MGGPLSSFWGLVGAGPAPSRTGAVSVWGRRSSGKPRPFREHVSRGRAKTRRHRREAICDAPGHTRRCRIRRRQLPEPKSVHRPQAAPPTGADPHRPTPRTNPPGAPSRRHSAYVYEPAPPPARPRAALVAFAPRSPPSQVAATAPLPLFPAKLALIDGSVRCKALWRKLAGGAPDVDLGFCDKLGCLSRLRMRRDRTEPSISATNGPKRGIRPHRPQPTPHHRAADAAPARAGARQAAAP